MPGCLRAPASSTSRKPGRFGGLDNEPDLEVGQLFPSLHLGERASRAASPEAPGVFKRGKDVPQLGRKEKEGGGLDGNLGLN